MPITITRRFVFDAAHRILNHESKCRYLHGHRYEALVTVTASALDELGRIIDFGVVKATVGDWINEFLDHNTILDQADPLLPHIAEITGKTPYICVIGQPTAENIAALIGSTANWFLPKDIHVVSVRVYETENCYADWIAPPPNPNGD